jgi:hypothetical protein
MEYLFLGCDRRLGMYRANGPVTGTHLEIPMTGTWINSEDAYELLEIIIPYFCHRSKRNLEIHPVFELSYTEDQLKTKPSN